MAKFRMIYTEFWDDPKVVEELTPEDKYFFLYLLTNAKTTQIGIYQITKKQMAFDLGYSFESVNALLDRFINYHKIVRYNPETREIAIRNWGKYNLNRGGKPMLDCVKSELKEIKDIALIHYVAGQVLRDDIREIYESYNGRLTSRCNEKKTDIQENDVGNKEKWKSNQDSASDDTCTIRGQEEQQEKEQEEYQDKEQQQDKEVGAIMQFWDENGFGVNNIHAKEQLLSWLDDSSFKEPNKIILKALNIACENDARRLKYTEGILKNWENESLLTVKEIDNSNRNRNQQPEEKLHFDPQKDRF